MRTAGWVLFLLGLIFIPLSHYIAPEMHLLLIIFGSSMLAGLILLLANGINRLRKGEVVLRPFDAMKKAIWLFLLMLGIRLLIYFVFPNFEQDITVAILNSAIFAIVFSFYTTAYRKSV